MRILVSALGCNPHLGSESLVGYKMAQCLARRHEVTVIAAQPAEAPPGVELHTVDAGRCQHNDVSCDALLRFEMAQIVKARRLHRASPFDVVHRATPSAIHHPSWLPGLGATWVMGPLLGSEPPPASFRTLLDRPATPPQSRFHPERLTTALTRRVIAWKADSPWRFQRARAILLGNQAAWRQTPEESLGRCHAITYAGVEHDRFVPAENRPRGEVSIVYVGRLVPYKGVELLLRAAARAARECAFHLRLIGDGDPAYVAFCRRLIEELKLEGTMVLVPWVPRSELPRVYREADIFCFPTLCDTYGLALLEAMSSGCAVLTSDVAGPAEIVAKGTGIKVPLRDPEDYVGWYSAALVALVRDQALRVELGRCARQRILEYHDWDRIAGDVLGIYERLEEEERGQP